jgi:FkbM family methyltransferase
MTRKRGPVVATVTTIHALLRRVGFDVVRWPRPHDLDGALAATLTNRRVTCVLDVGANEGEFSRHVRSLGFRGRIVSFEPSPVPLGRLESLAARDPAWSVRPVALGAQAGVARLHRHADPVFDSLHPSVPSSHTRFPGLADAGSVEVRVETLADERPKAVSGIAHPRVLLKSDTQGHDLDVLRGDPGLPDVVAVLVELSAQAIYDNQVYMTRCIDHLRDEGFTPVAFRPVTLASDHLSVIEFDGLFVRPS